MSSTNTNSVQKGSSDTANTEQLSKQPPLPGHVHGVQLFDPRDLTKETTSSGILRIVRAPQPTGISKPKPAHRKLRTSEIAYEQFVVGHFLRYVSRVIHSIMRASLQRTEVTNKLHAHMKQVWSEWVHSKITKKHLLHSIVRFVVFNCPHAKAARVDLVRDFPGWCETEFGVVSAVRGKGKR